MSLKVLICDTDRRFTERASEFLSSHGHHVLCEPQSRDALDMAERWKPDVLVVSSELVDREGDDFIRQIRGFKPSPALLLTGQLDRFDAAWRAWRKGADELLLKPVIHGWELHTAIIGAIEASRQKLLGKAASA